MHSWCDKSVQKKIVTEASCENVLEEFLLKNKTWKSRECRYSSSCSLSDTVSRFSLTRKSMFNYHPLRKYRKKKKKKPRSISAKTINTTYNDDNNFPSPRNFSNLIRRSYHHLAPPVSSSFWYLKKENFYGAFRPSPSPSIRILILFFFFPLRVPCERRSRLLVKSLTDLSRGVFGQFGKHLFALAPDDFHPTPAPPVHTG